MKIKLRVAEKLIINAMLITLIACQGIYAVEETLPTPEEIISKNIEAIGGIKSLNKIENQKIISRSINTQKDNDVKETIYKERPNKYFYIEDRGEEGKLIMGSDGKIIWEINPVAGAFIFEGDQLSNALIERLFYGPDGPDARYKSMKTEGIEQINGKACYKVVKTPEKGTERIVYYDKESYLIVKTMVYNTSQQGNYKKEEYYKYQKINNILFPHKIVFYFEGNKFAEIIYEKIELNIEMPEYIFDIPDEVKAIIDKNETEQRH